jgi:glyoxylase-like metal-dependent hydrolase (beta-lactamase superfamily II)
VATSRRDHTTTTVVSGDSEVLLVDPSWEPDELADLGRDLDELALRPTVGLSTHAHYDHLLWHPSYGSVPRWASAETCRLAAEERDVGLAELGPDWPADLAALYGGVAPFTDSTLPWSGTDVVLLTHDAHIPGHTAAWLPELGLLIAGDMLSDIEIPLPSEAPDALESYAVGLELLAPYAEAATLVVPGHGSPTSNGRGRVEADRRYLEAVMAGHRSTDPRLDNPGMAEAHAATMRSR